MQPVLFGQLVKVTGGADAAERKDVASRFAQWCRREGMEGEHLSAYGDEYVAYKAAADDDAEKSRIADLVFFVKQAIMGMAYRDTRGVTDPAERQQIIDGHFDRYDFKLKPKLEKHDEWDVAQLRDAMGPEETDTVKE